MREGIQDCQSLQRSLTGVGFSRIGTADVNLSSQYGLTFVYRGSEIVNPSPQTQRVNLRKALGFDGRGAFGTDILAPAIPSVPSDGSGMGHAARRRP